MILPSITAHSGCEGTPRDSIDSISHAIALGADIVEMDVRRAADGVLRISHDQVTETEYASKLTLQNVFESIAGTGLGLNCDVKEPMIVYDVLAMGERFGYGPGTLFLSGSTSPEQLACDPGIAKRANVLLNIEQVLKILYLPELYRQNDTQKFCELMNQPWEFVNGKAFTSDETESMLELVETVGAYGVNLPHQLLTEDLAERMRARKLPFSVWTVNRPEEVARCLRLGAHNVTTLTVKSALEQRKNILAI